MANKNINPLIEKVDYYASPNGCHFHTKKDCVMLQGENFERFKYRQIEFSTVERRHLIPCPFCSPDFYGNRFKGVDNNGA